MGFAGGLVLLSYDLAAATVRRTWRFMPLEKLDFQTFAAQLHTVFQVALEGGNVPLELIEATEGASRQAGKDGMVYESFSLFFAGPLQPVLEQRIHSVQHPRIGQFEVFIVPVVSRDPSGMRYECIFNRPQVRRT
jgi:hypothetical protein